MKKKLKKEILSWNDVKERYLEFHRIDKFTENMAIDIDFGYWLVNNCIIPNVVKSLPNKYRPQCGEPIAKPHKFWCEANH